MIIYIFYFWMAFLAMDKTKSQVLSPGTPEEEHLFHLINKYRVSRGLEAIPFSASLTKVAQVHARDLMENYKRSNRCNMHSWSKEGPWTDCCYKDNHKDPHCMWDKPREIAGYDSPGYEIAYWHSAAALLQVSLSSDKPVILRAEALSALSRQPLDDWKQVIPLLEVSDENLAIAAARYLYTKIGEEAVKIAMESALNDGSSCESEALRQQLMLALYQDTGVRPDTREIGQWEALLDGAADPVRGRRVFYSNSSLCSTCHAVDGRGGDLGPDLSNVGKSKDRSALIRSILLPSEEMSPEWQGWYIEIKDGTRYDGRQIDVGDNNIKLYTQAESYINVQKDDMADYGMTASSLMPSGLERRLSNQDLKDLLAFLESQ